mgnify:CR=1 FL=1
MVEKALVHRERLTSGKIETREDGIEIVAITAGTGNGWLFGADALRESLALWEGVECFVDHAWPPRSIRDLAGSCSQPRWDETLQGVRLNVSPCGPSAQVLIDLACAQKDGQANPHVGFSADLVFSALGNQVTRIEKVYSVDLVTSPARGGGFLPPVENVSEPIQEEVFMEQNEIQQVSLSEERTPTIQSPTANDQAGAAETRQSMCECLLETTLAAARLPSPLENSLRSRFGGSIFQPAALQTAVNEARQLMSDLNGGTVIRGAGRISEMACAEDQVSAALHDLFGAARPRGLENLQAARLSGIRELYTLMTGDTEFSGGYHAERAQFSTTANLPSVLKNVMNKLILNQWEELGRSGYRWWEPVVQVEHFNSLQEITGVLVGEVTVLPSVEEGAAYTELAVKDSEEAGTWGKYGGYVGLTLEMF